MSDIDPFLFSYNEQNTLEEITTIRAKYPPKMPLVHQLEIAWLAGDDETASEIAKNLDRIDEITGRHTII
ncbi:MAG: hypothetical protein WCJ60_02795 [bacterium]